MEAGALDSYSFHLVSQSLIIHLMSKYTSVCQVSYLCAKKKVNKKNYKTNSMCPKKVKEIFLASSSPDAIFPSINNASQIPQPLCKQH